MIEKYIIISILNVYFSSSKTLNYVKNQQVVSINNYLDDYKTYISKNPFKVWNVI